MSQGFGTRRAGPFNHLPRNNSSMHLGRTTCPLFPLKQKHRTPGFRTDLKHPDTPFFRFFYPDVGEPPAPFNDQNGYRTGIVQKWKEATLTLGYMPTKHIEFDAEVRQDRSNKPAFLTTSGTGKDSQASLGLEAIYKF